MTTTVYVGTDGLLRHTYGEKVPPVPGSTRRVKRFSHVESPGCPEQWYVEVIPTGEMVGPFLTRESALMWEVEHLEQFLQNGGIF